MTGVDIGREPALSFATHARDETPGRRMLNIRWLACTVLTGVAGAALMGGALFIAFDRQSEFALPPHSVLASTTDGVLGNGRSDRLVLASERISSRQVIQETMVRNVGGKEFVQVMPYVRVTASLASSVVQHANRIPAFNPNEIFASVGAMERQADAAVATAEPDDDDILTVSYAPLDPVGTAPGGGEALDVAEIEQMLRETYSGGVEALSYAPAPPLLPVSAPDIATIGGMDMHMPLAPAELFRAAGAGANTTTIAKRKPRLFDALELTQEQTVTVNRGDTVMSILVAHGASHSEAMEIISRLEEEGASLRLAEGDIVQVTLAPRIDDPDRLRPVGASLPAADGESVVATVDTPSFLQKLASLGSIGLRRSSPVVEPARATSDSSQHGRANIFDALYETGLTHDVPLDMIDDLVRIFAFDVDFQRRVSAGDTVELFYAETGEEQGADEPEILFAAITLRGEMQRFYRFRHPEDGVVDYYDETGKSAKKFLMRKPMSGGTFRSGFGMRRHPILGYTRMHSGVDWAAPTGTPIMASGSGTVIEAQWRSGYGKHVRIRHANGYESSYSHMSGFADGVVPGARVHQGQTIGYVGSTGMSTGPHLHYEVTVNGRHVDPMRIRLPRGRTLEGRVLAAFEKETARIDALINRAPTTARVAAR